ncbi:MAG: MerR family transcriptional regulator [Sarcina sp.]
MKDFYKIGEISKIYNIGKDSLMYYERLGIINPVRDENAYRLYSISDIWRLNLVKELKELGFSMKMVKEYIDNRDIENTKNLLNMEIEILDARIEEFKKKKEEVIKRIEVLKNEDKTILNKIQLKYIEKRNAIVLNGDIRKDEEADFLIKKLHKKFEERFNMLGNNNIGAIFSREKLEDKQYNFYESVFCFLDEENEEISNIKFENGKYLCLSYKGDYKQKGMLIEKMFNYIKKHSLILDGKVIEIYKIDIHETSKTSEFITEIQMKVK